MASDVHPGEVTYPPEPWHLGGTMHVSLWRVPVDALPASFEAARPASARPVVVGGHALVGTAFVAYEPGSVLVYDELLCATLTWYRRRPRVTISDIWVDSPASAAGGRELWGIPKHLASFTRERRGRRTELAAHRDGRELTRAVSTAGVRLPGRWPLRMPTAQHLDGRDHDSRVRAFGALAPTRTEWHFAPDGPLAFLAGRSPMLSARLEELALAFGSARP